MIEILNIKFISTKDIILSNFRYKLKANFINNFKQKIKILIFVSTK